MFTTLSASFLSKSSCYKFQRKLENAYNLKSKAPVSQLVNADDTSVIEIKTQHYLES